MVETSENASIDKSDSQDREKIREFARQLQDGQKMADIFGLDDETMTSLEVQAYRLYQNGQFNQAKVAGRGVLALDEDRALTRLIMGAMALDEYHFGDAVEHLRRAYELSPDELAVRARLGEALLQNGNAEEARGHLEAVVSADDTRGRQKEQTRCQALLDVLHG